MGIRKGRGLHLSTAFDTVNHATLIKLLQQNFGVDDTALKWMISYLQGSKMQTQVGQAFSSVKTFNFSVPRGSCLTSTQVPLPSALNLHKIWEAMQMTITSWILSNQVQDQALQKLSV